MSAERLSWFFELQEKLSGPAGKAAGAMAKLESNAHGAGGALEKLHDIVEIAYEAPQILAEVWERASEAVADAIDEMHFKSNSLLALGALTGSAEKAKAVWEEAEAFAYHTGENVRDVMRLTKDLVNSGFDTADVSTLRLVLQDLRVVDPSKADAVGSALGEIGRRGYMASREMKALSAAGVDETKMWAALSAELGISAAKLRAMPELKVAAGTAATAIAKVVATKYAGGVAGSLAAQEAQTLPKLLDRVKQIPDKIMDALLGIEDVGGANTPFAGFLNNLLEVFDPDSAAGKRVAGKVREFGRALGEAFGLGGDFFADLSGPKGVQKIEEAMKRLLSWMQYDFIPALQAIASTVSTIGKAAMTIKAAVGGGDQNLWDTGEKIDRAMVAAGAAGNDEARAALGKDQQFRDLALAGDLDEIKRRYSSGRPLNVEAVRAWGAQSSLNVNVTVQGARSEEDGKRVGRAVAREMELQGVGQGGSGGGQ